MRDLLACILKLGGGRKVKKDIQHHECKLQGREAIVRRALITGSVEQNFVAVLHEQIKLIVDELRRDEVEAIYLFGSYAKGNAIFWDLPPTINKIQSF